jgi:hypothetical protein
MGALLKYVNTAKQLGRLLHSPPFTRAMAPRHNDRMDIDSDSDISIDFEQTTSKGKGKSRAKAGDKRKADKGKGKAKDTVHRFRTKNFVTCN